MSARSAILDVLLGFVLLMLLALPAGAETSDQPPSQRFQIDPAHLPSPNPDESVANSPNAVPVPSSPPFRAPPGFKVNAFASGLGYARWLEVAPNGDIFLARPDRGQIVLLRDRSGHGEADLVSVFASGFDRPHGMAFHGNYLYVADVRGVWRLPWQPGDVKARGAAAGIVTFGIFGMSFVGVHWTRNIVFAPDGQHLFVAYGSHGNLDVEAVPRATVQSFAADGSDQRTFASGLRNPVGIAFYPGTNDLYVVVNERDGMGDGLVPDYLTRLKAGGFYGWPYAYLGQHRQPDFPARSDLVAKAIVPDLLFQAHSAPLGLVFYEGKMFPPEYNGDAFVALHGSWNATKPTGYKVVRVPFKKGRPIGYYENFLTGFWIDGQTPANVFGRPVGLAVAADGSLLVADDVSGSIWRVSYRKP